MEATESGGRGKLFRPLNDGYFAIGDFDVTDEGIEAIDDRGGIGVDGSKEGLSSELARVRLNNTQAHRNQPRAEILEVTPRGTRIVFTHCRLVVMSVGPGVKILLR